MEFGWRSRIIGTVGVGGIGLWGVLLSGLHSISSTSAFVTLFAMAAGFRFMSLYYMTSMVDLPLHPQARVRHERRVHAAGRQANAFVVAGGQVEPREQEERPSCQ